MSAERRVGIGGKVAQGIYNLFNPYKRLEDAIIKAGGTIEKAIEGAGGTIEQDDEISPEQTIEIENARNELNSAYSNLGDKKGENIETRQITAVLQAELNLLRILPRNPSILFFNEAYIDRALEFGTPTGIGGLSDASTFMIHKANCWREIARRLPDNLRIEEERRVKACENASKLLTSMMFPGQPPNILTVTDYIIEGNVSISAPEV